MSANDDEINRREVAWRVFASEFRDADYSYAESDEERAPNYVVTPTGARVNRMFLVGVLTEVEYVSDDYVRARIVDPTGAFVVYAGQYQPDALTFLESAETPSFVAVTGKARTFQPEDADVVYTSVRPESISEVDAATRDRWVVTTAEQTLERVATFADALDRVERGDDLRDALEASGVPEGLASGIPLAISHYGTTEHYLAAVRDLSLDAARVVTGDVDEVDRPMVDPSDEGDGTVHLPEYSLVTEEAPPSATPEPDVTAGAEAEAEFESPAETEAATEAAAETEPGTEAATESATETESETERESVDGFEPGEPAESEAEPGAGTAEEPEPAESESAEAETAEPETSTYEEPADAAETAAETGEDVSPGETDEMYELSEEERREVEENFGVEFTTGDEVPEPGEVDIEPEAGEPAAEAETGATPESEPEPEPEPEPEFESEEAAAETAAEFEAERESASEEAQAAAEEEAEGGVEDLEDVVVDTMQALGDGGGADRDELVATVVDEYGVEPGDVEDAIQDALMAGRCFESGDDELQAI